MNDECGPEILLIIFLDEATNNTVEGITQLRFVRILLRSVGVP